MRRYLAVVTALFALGGWAGSAAAASDTSVAVLGIEPIDVPQALATQLTEALRQRAGSTAGVRLVQGKDLIEVKMVFGCDGEAPACMAQAGKALGTDKLLYGTVKKASKTSVTVALKLLDVKSATVEKFVNDNVPRRELSGSQLGPAATRWFGQLLEIDAKPTLTVSSDPPGATVTVDGQGYGRTPLTLRELAAGSHSVTVSLSGRLPATRSVELRPGGSHDLSVTLDPEPAAVASKPPAIPPEPTPLPPEPAPHYAPPPPPHGHPGRAAKIAGLALAGGALITAGVAIYTWRHYVDLENQAHNELNNLTATPNTGMDPWLNKNPTCVVPGNIAPSKPVGPNGIDPRVTYTNACNAGNDYANATTALWSVTGALAAAGLVSFLVGNHQAHAAKERPTATIMRETLRVAPIFSTQGGGMSAAFEF